MKSLSRIFTQYSSAVLLLAVNAAAQINAAAQNRPGKAATPEPSFFESYGIILLGGVAIIGLIGVVIMLRKKKAGEVQGLALKSPDDGLRMTYRAKAKVKETAPVQRVERNEANPSAVPIASKAGFAALPVNSFVRVQRTNPFLRLPESHDPTLLEAIERSNEETEEDVQQRTRALALLATSKTANSMLAIAQVALYDLSSKLRSDAVNVLAEMDHESVFETMVTACADPTREVRAAAARGLFKLTFDRSHAWARVIESGDVSRMRHVARCAIEGDVVQRSFDRLAHTDRKIAYEAFALTALLIHAGETEPIFKTLGEHRDENVKLALLHVLQTIKDENTFEGLSQVLATYNLSPNIADKVNEVRSCLQMTHA